MMGFQREEREVGNGVIILQSSFQDEAEDNHLKAKK